ncbi:MAG: RtsE [Planctomycetales bacterium 4484_113]|nr:MAG: RtsE [Planctomycetales bacterium 4484_113]
MEQGQERSLAPAQNVLEDQRIAIFIDVQNMFYSAKSIFKKKLNFDLLVHTIARGRRLVRAVAYIVQSPEVDQTKFIEFLDSIGVEVKIKALKVRPDGTSKGDWDMGIAIDTINLASKVDVIALVSGDGDFTVLVQKLQALGVKVEVYAFPSSTAEELRKIADYYYPLDADMLLF